MPLDREIYTKCKKETLSNLIKVISSYNICYGINSQKANKKKKKKRNCHSVQKASAFSHNSSVPFH